MINYIQTYYLSMYLLGIENHIPSIYIISIQFNQGDMIIRENLKVLLYCPKFLNESTGTLNTSGL